MHVSCYLSEFTFPRKVVYIMRKNYNNIFIANTRGIGRQVDIYLHCWFVGVA
jgi:hypothetical protein